MFAKLRYRNVERAFRISDQLRRNAEKKHVKFCELELDETGRKFLDSCRKNRPGTMKTMLHRLRVMHKQSFYDAQADMYSLHLASLTQIKSLLSVAGLSNPMFQNILDVGAGEGKIATDILSNIGDNIFVTETSEKYFNKLKEKGLTAAHADLSHQYPFEDQPHFDLLVLLNVLDRTQDPGKLIQGCLERILPGGLVLISSPLPFRPVYYGKTGLSPVPSGGELAEIARDKFPEKLGMEGSALWEDSAEWFMFDALPSFGLTPLVFSRMPYLVSGDMTKDFSFHENIILLAERR